MPFHPTKPCLFISVLLRPGLTNFSGLLIQAKPQTLKEKFSAGNFVSFVVKRKKPVRPGQKKS